MPTLSLLGLGWLTLPTWGRVEGEQRQAQATPQYGAVHIELCYNEDRGERTKVLIVVCECRHNGQVTECTEGSNLQYLNIRLRHSPKFVLQNKHGQSLRLFISKHTLHTSAAVSQLDATHNTVGSHVSQLQLSQ